MPRLKIDNNIFYTELNVSKEKIRYEDGYREGTFNQENLIKDIDEKTKKEIVNRNLIKLSKEAKDNMIKKYKLNNTYFRIIPATNRWHFDISKLPKN